ncbi:uncharacterized protein LOC128872488 isoform X1 [Hylaeus volcanicus]|uniref:uncharacterized protein LOC128872488 isoform X1 n=1 Tax=Hylaeus volcanicus TaxID=313075 RepID=UPI0023B868FF|nr:uncharacterized protein LOC128872488 isoform X1 [Hylaeus volcanicus]
MSFSSFSSHVTKSKGMHSQTLNKWDIKDLENYECNEHKTRNIKHFTRNSRKIDKDICFSDTDLQFLIIPISSNKSNVIKHDGKVELCKWNSEDINDFYDERNNTSSKLLEFKFHNTDSYSDNTQTHEISNSKSNCSPRSFVSKNLASDSKYLTDSAANRFDNLPNIYLTKLQRLTNSSASSTVPDISSINEIKTEHPRADTSNIKSDRLVSHIKFEKNNSKYFPTNRDNITAIVELNVIKSKIRLDGYVGQFEKMKRTKSSMDIRLNHFKENWPSIEDQLENSRRKSKSDENFIHKNALYGTRNDNTKYYFVSQDISSEPEKIVYNNQGVYESATFNSEASEICDELGILFSRYIKLEAQPCVRKYCPISRRLKQRARHSIKKCQTKSNYHQIYPYDQRPACNSGNVCADTYDELKLMHTSPLERTNIYRCMFNRRKRFLNQPCTLSNQNLPGSI